VSLVDGHWKSQSPENGSRLCKSGFAASHDQAHDQGRNPLRTGLGSARLSAIEEALFAKMLLSQSPENGSRHSDGCGAVLLILVMVVSQSPENGSWHSDGRQTGKIIPTMVWSQSPENGSRLCKLAYEHQVCLGG
jgi:hypothetical protein